MGAFSQVIAQMPRKPPRVVELPPSGFADTWANKPTVPERIGLRLLAEGDMASARSEAAQRAARQLPGVDPSEDVWIEAYNQALMHWAIAASQCHPENVDVPLWDMAYDMVPRMLSHGGTERLYDEIELLKVTDSPTSPEIDRDETTELIESLRTGAFWDGMSVGDKRAAGRLLRRVLELGHRIELTIDDEG